MCNTISVFKKIYVSRIYLWGEQIKKIVTIDIKTTSLLKWYHSYANGSYGNNDNPSGKSQGPGYQYGVLVSFRNKY